MSTTIKLRRSAIAGRIPTTAQLELGELAINTQDGKIYFKKYDSVSNTESIIDISSNLDAAAILAELITVDGPSSGLDADLLDGQEGTYYLDWGNFTNTATGVTANTYGSSTAIPVLTVDADGRITLANTAPIAGVDNTEWTTANSTFTIRTADGGIFDTQINEFHDLTVNGNVAIEETMTANNIVVAEHIIAGSLSVLGNIDTPNQTDSGNLIANSAVIEHLTVNNDIIVNGLVDGRDVAADGAELDGLTVTLSGKVTGTGNNNLSGTIAFDTELANTGVTAGIYGSSTAIPVFTVDEDGRLTTANTTPVAGVDNFSYAAANNTITLETGDGSIFNIQTETEVTLSGKVTGTATATDGNVLITTELANTGVIAGSYGTASQIPVLTIDEDGRVTAASNTAVAGVEETNWYSANNTFAIETGDGSVFNTVINSFNQITANTINGRDVTADGNKLDGIEPLATADQTPAEILSALLTVDGDGSGLDADTIDGYSASEILDAAANNAQSLIGAGNITITANNGMIGVAEFNVNTANNESFTLEHGDTSGVVDVSLNQGRVLTGLTFDTYGHVQNTTSSDLDDRYYTETEADANFVDITGDTMTGDLTVQGNIDQNESRFVSTTVNTTSASQSTLYSFDGATYAAMEVSITALQGADAHMTKLLVTHDSSTAIATEYGVVFTGTELADYDVDMSVLPAGFVQIKVTPASANSTDFKVVGTLISA